MTFRMMKTAGLLGAGLLALAACSKSEPEPPAPDNTALEATPTAEPTPEPVPSAEPAPATTPAPTAAAADVPPDAPVAPDAQMIDDADATGMTARVRRDEAPAANDSAAQ